MHVDPGTDCWTIRFGGNRYDLTFANGALKRPRALSRLPALIPTEPTKSPSSMAAAKRGAIVNIASIHADMTYPGMFPYAAAKAGLVGLTRSLALEVGRHHGGLGARFA